MVSRVRAQRPSILHNSPTGVLITWQPHSFHGTTISCWIVNYTKSTTWGLLLNVFLIVWLPPAPPRPCPWRSFVLVFPRWMPGKDFSYKPSLRYEEVLEILREKLKRNFKASCRSSLILSSNPLSKMCVPKENQNSGWIPKLSLYVTKRQNHQDKKQSWAPPSQ